MAQKEIYGEVLKLYSDGDLAKHDALPRAAVSAGHENAWPALCCAESGKSILEIDLLARVGANDNAALVSGDCVGSMFRLLSEKIFYGTGGLSAAQEVDKVRRLGLALHYCLLRDVKVRSEWNAEGVRALDKWNAPRVHREEVVPESIVPNEAWWLWKRIFRQESPQRVEPVSTKAVFVNKHGGEGVVGVLKVALIESDEVGGSRSGAGFVPSPSSFAYCLDSEIRKSFENAHHYLKDLAIWPNNACVEWDIKLVSHPPVPDLGGGSAGAAIALAAGSLLAKRQMWGMDKGA